MWKAILQPQIDGKYSKKTQKDDNLLITN